jgi:aspartyl-tRNA(Asn)/glutamyl-tRNA(Gln) amidotransferase subunit B
MRPWKKRMIIFPSRSASSGPEQSFVDETPALAGTSDEKKARLMASGLSAYDASVLVAEKDVADYFEAMIAEGADAKACANWLINEYFGRLNKAGLTISSGPISSKAASTVVQMVASNLISGKIAKDVVDIVWREGGDPRAIVQERGLEQVSDTGAIEAAIDAIVAANPAKSRK